MTWLKRLIASSRLVNYFESVQFSNFLLVTALSQHKSIHTTDGKGKQLGVRQRYECSFLLFYCSDISNLQTAANSIHNARCD